MIPWGNPDVLALYRKRLPVRNLLFSTQLARWGAAHALPDSASLLAQSGRYVRPYAKWFTLQGGVFFYKTVYGAKRNCPIVFNWRVPPNAVSFLYNLRGVVYSRKGGAPCPPWLLVGTV